ncbi:site-specific integrase [Dactylosporangium sp. NPDC050688]|uniref:site-specific integrase n=1 Tax=Dactylosporangium sp. NPDC050688 TaxID=3157217 RepID=UPI003408B41B
MPGSGAVSWTVVGDDLLPVPAVEAFLSYLAAVERSPLTVRTYAHDLAVYFRFLAERGVDWRRASLDLLSGYIFWLRRPASNVVVLDVEQSRRAPRTVTGCWPRCRRSTTTTPAAAPKRPWPSS